MACFQAIYTAKAESSLPVPKLSQNIEQYLAGILMLPPASVPTATGTRPAAVAYALPPDEPPQ